MCKSEGGKNSIGDKRFSLTFLFPVDLFVSNWKFCFWIECHMVMLTVNEKKFCLVRCKHYDMEVDCRQSVLAEFFDKSFGPSFLLLLNFYMLNLSVKSTFSVTSTVSTAIWKAIGDKTSIRDEMLGLRFFVSDWILSFGLSSIYYCSQSTRRPFRLCHSKHYHMDVDRRH